MSTLTVNQGQVQPVSYGTSAMNKRYQKTAHGVGGAKTANAVMAGGLTGPLWVGRLILSEAASCCGPPRVVPTCTS